MILKITDLFLEKYKLPLCLICDVFVTFIKHLYTLINYFHLIDVNVNF